MKVQYTKNFAKKSKKTCRKRPQLQSVLNKQLLLFAHNPKHPSLKSHKLVGGRSDQYAIWITGDLRALYVPSKSGCVFFDLIDHDQY